MRDHYYAMEQLMKQRQKEIAVRARREGMLRAATAPQEESQAGWLRQAASVVRKLLRRGAIKDD
ncbi:hypothetical protein [Paenibacillus sp. NPDC058071]|uniref:hypothetical protein n=1 Tax=Paenibacillus sp. NPDC058071 TaxID=3346326 RepID=UPI0036DBAD9E